MRLQIAGLFLVLLAGAGLALGFVASRDSRVLVEKAATASFAGGAELALQELRRLEATARTAAEALATDPIARSTQPEERRAGLHTLAAMLRAVPGISAAYIGWPDGDFVLLRPVGALAGRQPDTLAGQLDVPPGAVWLAQWTTATTQRFDYLDGGLAIVETRYRADFGFDPRQRPWFIDASNSVETIVTRPYRFFTTREPGITAARRSPSGGVAGVDLSLWDLSMRLPVGWPVASTEVVIFDLDGAVLADADTTRLRRIVAVRPDGDPALRRSLPAAAELRSPVLTALADRWRRDTVAFSGTLAVDGREWRVALAPLGPHGMAVAMAAAADELAAGPNGIRDRLLLVFALAVALGVPIVWLAARLVARPVEAFAREAEAVASLDFSARPPLSTPVSELADLDAAVSAMRSALRSFDAVSRGFAEEQDIHGILAATLDAVMAAGQAGRGAAWLVEAGAAFPEIVVVRGEWLGAPDPATGTPALVHRIVAADGPFVVTMAAGDPALGDLAGGAGELAVLCVPLRAGRDRVVGALAIARPAIDGAPFAAPLLSLAQAIARPVALAVDRCRLIAGQHASLEQLRLLETAVSRLNDLVLITEAEPIEAPDGPRIVYVNEAFVRRTGFTREEAIGRTPRILQGLKTQRDELDRIDRALRAWQPVRSELVNYTKDGREFWLELDIVPIADATGWFTHWVAVERDVTERKLADAAARVSQERFELVSQATNDVIWDWEMASDAIWWNAGLLTLFGHDPAADEPGSGSWTSRIHPDDRERVTAGIYAVIDGTGRNWLDEYRFVRADGTYATVIDRGFVIRDAAGAAVRMLGSMTDVTERRELDERLRQSQKLEAVGQLTGGVAHDFNNLLTVIIGNAEALVDGLAGDRALRQLAEMTQTAGERAAELTNRLLAFARRQALEPRIVDLARLLAGMEGLLRRTLTGNIEFRIEARDGVWPALVDPGQLEVAILNLALNARDAMPDGGRLTISAENVVLDDDYARTHEEVAPGRYVLLSVSDSGTGMPPDVAARAFDPFFTTKEVGKGSGLGLSMVYGFVKQSKGHANIRTAVGAGTTVRLYLPRADAGGPEALPPVRRRLASGGVEHILLVEDHQLVREHAVKQLQALGYRVTAAVNGAEGLAIVRSAADIDLLFTDVVMPGGMNGRQLADAARRVRPELRVLLASGYAEQGVIDDGLTEPGYPLLLKPYRREGLAAKVRAVLDGR